MHGVVLGHLARLRLGRLSLLDRGVAEAADDVLEPALGVVDAEPGGALALADRVRALAQLLEAALVHLALGVGCERGVRLVVLGALDAVLLSATCAHTRELVESYRLRARPRRAAGQLVRPPKAPSGGPRADTHRSAPARPKSDPEDFQTYVLTQSRLVLVDGLVLELLEVVLEVALDLVEVLCARARARAALHVAACVVCA